MKLRDALLNALAVLPGSRRFHLHVLVSAPRKYSSLFPYATSRPRVYAQDILILCSEQKDVAAPRILVTAIEAAVYAIPASSSAIFYVSKVDSTGQGSRPSPTAALVRALLGFYVHPATRPFAAEHLWVHLFARAQGQYLFPNSSEHPEKRPLSDVRLCAWWKRVYTQVAREVMADVEQALPKPRLYYVLPGMDELEAKQALGELMTNTAAAEPGGGGVQWTYGHPYSQTDVPLPYVVKGSKKDGKQKQKQKHNLGQMIPSFEDDPKTRFMDEIACTTRVDGLRSPKRKRTRRASGSASASASAPVSVSASVSDKPQTDGGNNGDSDWNGEADGNNELRVDHGPPGGRKHSREKEDRERIPGELGIVSADEFWERMSFRQECVAGAVTGFFVAIYSWPTTSTSTSNISSNSNSDARASSEGGVLHTSNPLAPQPGNVSFQMVRRIVASLLTAYDFATTEKTLRATEVLEGAIKGLCSNSNSNSNSTLTATATAAATATSSGGGSAGARQANTIASSASDALGPALVPIPEEGVRSERKTKTKAPGRAREAGLESPGEVRLPLVAGAPERLLASPRTPPRREASLPSMSLDNSTGMSLGVAQFHDLEKELSVSPNPFPEPIASEDTYTQFIYGSIAVENPNPNPPGPHGAVVGIGSDGREGAGGAGGGADAVPGGRTESERKPTPTVTVLAVRRKKRR